jgi:hypothetical protein
MSSNNCGKGLVIFSIAFVFGLCLSDIFTIQESVKPKATEKITIFEPPKPNNCSPDYKKFDQLATEDKNHAKLNAKRTELRRLELSIRLNQYSTTEKLEFKKRIDKIQAELVTIEIANLKNKLKLAENDWSEKRTLLYTEKCYEHKF